MKNNPVANLWRAKSSGAPVLLHYHNEPSDKKQARFLGREKLVPDIALEDFTCRAVID
ncbi:hypothetical protein [Pseudogemmobacter sp. W21_MBD1_M6]|uniref:hypothetical protein n=1 Tax=Pseudogemmobacter sp. W21_MBD1_M6 TaxID=3240271 RepID=UPI003F9A238A